MTHSALPTGTIRLLAVLGVLAAGGTYVPIGFDQPDVRRAKILATAGAVAALTVDMESLSNQYR